MLAGGTGSRLRPLTYTGAKQLLPVANRPILFYVVEAMVEAGVTDIGVVVGETADAIRRALGSGEGFGCRFTYIPQAAPLGLAHAVQTAEPFLGDAPFLMMLGDNLLRSGLAGLTAKVAEGQLAAAILLCPVPNPEQFGVAVVEAGRVVRLVEKPSHPPSNLALVGAYAFGPAIHRAVATLEPSWRGEYEITDAIQRLIDWGLPVEASEVRGWWKDTGRPEDVLEANRLVLDEIEGRPDAEVAGRVDDASQISGRVVIGADTEVRHSVIRGPVAIGRGCRITDAYIGPYTSIGDGSEVIASEVENSVVMDEVRIVAVPSRIDHSLIGRGAEIRGRTTLPRAVRLVLGDRSRVEV